MLPWQHALIALGPLVIYALVRYERLPRKTTVLMVLVASQLPDLVDKPLAYSFGVIPNGRMFFHSLVIAIMLSVLVLAVSRHYARADLGFAFAWGYLSHLPGDFYPALSLSPIEIPNNLLWPFAEVVYSRTPPDGYVEGVTVLHHAATSSIVIGVVLVSLLGIIGTSPVWFPTLLSKQ